MEIVVAEATLEEDVKDEVVLRQLLLMALIVMMYLAHSQVKSGSKWVLLGALMCSTNVNAKQEGLTKGVVVAEATTFEHVGKEALTVNDAMLVKQTLMCKSPHQKKQMDQQAAVNKVKGLTMTTMKDRTAVADNLVSDLAEETTAVDYCTMPHHYWNNYSHLCVV